jgi:hypothetical protein
MTINAMSINEQWKSRPDDERFLSMAELHAFNASKRQRSVEQGVALDHMLLMPKGGDMLLGQKGGDDGASMTNWAFGQLCQRVSAPAGYLRSVPAQLAAIPLQWSLENEGGDAKLLLRDETQRWDLLSASSSTYGRIYDEELSGAICKYMDLSLWKVPAASYATHDPKRATTLYASDRDMFVCLVDDQHPIDLNGTNGGEPLFRGFIARNSEVGAATLEILTFLYNRICDNRIIWGMQDSKSLKIRHTSGGPMRFVREAEPALRGYLESSTAQTIEQITKANRLEIGADDAKVEAWLTARGFTKPEAKRALVQTENDPANPRSVWGVVQGLTAAARDLRFGDERLDLERRAGKLLDAVS